MCYDQILLVAEADRESLDGSLRGTNRHSLPSALRDHTFDVVFVKLTICELLTVEIFQIC